VSGTAWTTATLTYAGTATSTALSTATGSDDQSSLAAYYKLEDQTGTDNYADSSTGSLTATATGVMTDGNGAIAGSSKSALFTGSASYVLVPGTLTTPPGAAPHDFTLSAWVRPSSVGTARKHILSYGTDASLFIDSDGILGCGGSTSPAKHAAALTAYQWVHAACVHDGSGWVVYLNGVASTPSTQALTPGTRQWAIGATYDSSGPTASGFFDGLIDEVRIYSSALNAAAVANLHGCNRTDCGGATSTVTQTLTIANSATATSTPTLSSWTTAVASGTATQSLSHSATGTGSSAGTASGTASATRTQTVTVSASASATGTASATASGTATASRSDTAAGTCTVTATASRTGSATLTTTDTVTVTASETATAIISVPAVRTSTSSGTAR
jgi:hypothetical protein